VRLGPTRGLGILRQLQLEEALLRADGGSWCLVHDGAQQPAAVLGLSGRVEAMLHAQAVEQTGLAVVRRFSGGGTVIVDADTLFVSFVFAAAATPGVACFPAPLMSWSEGFYRGVFHDLPDFRLRENGAAAGHQAAVF
jgi:lipoate-protein ligase A